MKVLFKLLLVLSCLCFQVSYSQNIKIDSLLEVISNTDIDTIKAKNYILLSDLTLYNDPEKANLYIENALQLYQNKNVGKGIAKSYSKKAVYFYTKSQYDSARSYLNKSIETSLNIGDELNAAIIRHNIGILDQYNGNWKNTLKIMDENIPVFRKHNDSLHLGNAYLVKGKVAYGNGYYNIALEETVKALKVHENQKNDFRTAEDLFQIGIIYQDLRDYSKSLDILIRSLTLYEKVNNTQIYAQVLNYLGLSNLKLKKIDQAKENFEEALSISKQLNYNGNISRSLTNLGRIDMKRKNYDDAIQKFSEALEIEKGIVETGYNVSMILDLIGDTYLNNNNNKLAIKYYDEAIENLDSIDDTKTIIDSYIGKSIALENLNDFKSALKINKSARELRDTIFTRERLRHVEELQIIYETERKEKEIAAQKNQIELLNQKAKITNLQRVLLGGALLLSLIGFYALRQKMKRTRLEKEKVDVELEFKKKELTTHALHLAKKNEVLESLKQKAEELKSGETSKNRYNQLIQTINFDLQDDNNWKNFAKYFEEVHKDFNGNVKQKFPSVTPNELRLLALLKMNLTSKEIANILNISPDGIKKARYRLRKKLNITTEESLQGLVLSL